MRFLKITIIAIFILFSAACFLLSANKKPVQKHHAQTVLRANPETVKGDFERENLFEFQGAKAEMSRIGDEFFIRFNDAETFKVEAVVGDEKLEEYAARKDGKLLHLPIAYDVRQKRWTHLTDEFVQSETAKIFQTFGDWETNCASCHLEQTAQNFPTDCASCHSKTLHESETEAIRFSAREHQGILHSVCFVQNKGGNVINCQSCHSSDVTEKPTEQACINCHQQFSAPDAIFEHTKHQSTSANCFSCHQPEIVYGHLEFQRTHEISVPNPELTVTKNIPNACNLCHTDKSVNWSITQTKLLWTENFRDTKTSNNPQFDKPEPVRAFASEDDFIRALTADSLNKKVDSKWFEVYKIKILNDESSFFVKYFLSQNLNK